MSVPSSFYPCYRSCFFNLIQYTKSHGDINPKAITPMGPFPNIEEGVESNWDNLKIGQVKHPAVLAYEATIPDL